MPSGRCVSSPHFTVPSLQRVRAWLLNWKDCTSPQLGYPQRFIDRFCRQHPQMETARRLAQDLIALFRKQFPAQLDAWIHQAQASGVLELRRFSAGLKRDYEAERAALEMPYSNGRVEGHINRLKYLKRQMYGRAGFELLRIRVLHSI